MKQAYILIQLIFSFVLAIVISNVLGSLYIAPILFLGGLLISYSYKNEKQILFAATCAKISAGVAPSCAFPMVGGTKTTLRLYNIDDVASFTRNSGNPQIIEQIVMKTGKVAYAWEGLKQSNSPVEQLVKGKYQPTYDHEHAFLVFDASPATKVQLELLAQGLVYAVYETNYKGVASNAAFQIMGMDIGLEVSAMKRDVQSADSQGGYEITLKTPDSGPKEGHLTGTVFVTDYDTTLALLDAHLD